MEKTEQVPAATTGARIRQIREERALSLDDVAYELRVRSGHRFNKERVRYYEVEKPEAIDIETLMEIIDILDVPLCELAPERVKEAERLALLINKALNGGCPRRAIGSIP